MPGFQFQKPLGEVTGAWEALSGSCCHFMVQVTPTARSFLFGAAWAVPTSESMPGSNGDGELEALSIREQIWLVLRSQGFSEFTERLAHRVFPELVEVVEVAPMDPAERKAWGLPTGLFRIGVGVFWPILQEDGLFRTNRGGKPRPKVAECHLSEWLMPERRRCAIVRSVFDSPQDARESLAGAAVRWFNSFGVVESGLSILQQDDWEIFWWYPMMRGCGAKSSTRRLIFLANHAYRLHRLDEAHEYLRLAERAIEDRYPEYLRPRYRKWLDAVRAKLTA